MKENPTCFLEYEADDIRNTTTNHDKAINDQTSVLQKTFIELLCSETTIKINSVGLLQICSTMKIILLMGLFIQ